MQAVIYTRVSSDEQVNGMSLEFQREDCIRYAAAKGITVSKIFEEKGESAKFADRPELLELLDYCLRNRGRLKVLIVWKIDRLSRVQMDYYFLKRTLLGYGISIQSATEPSLHDTSSIEGKIYETFSALQAEVDNMMRRDRTMRGMQAKIASGIYPWKPPLGYLCAQNRLKGQKKLEHDEPDPARFPLIQKLFATCLAQRITNNVTLAALANEWGLRTESGRRIYPQFVDRILGNKFYAGILVNPWTSDEFPGKHEPAVSQDDFCRIQSLRKRGVGFAREVRTLEHPDFPLRRTVKCGYCETPLTGGWSRGNGGRYAYYRCRLKQCTMYGKAVKKDMLEEQFSSALTEITPKESRVALLKEVIADLWKEKHQLSADQLRRNDKQLKDLEERLESLIAMKERELLTDDEFLSRKEKLKSDMAAVRASFSTTPMKSRSVDDLVGSGTQFISTLPSQWLVMSPEVRQRFQGSVFPSGISYKRGEGFGTMKTGLLYKVIEESRGSKTRLVPLVLENWNRLIDDLRLFAEVNDATNAECTTLVELDCSLPYPTMHKKITSRDKHEDVET